MEYQPFGAAVVNLRWKNYQQISFKNNLSLYYKHEITRVTMENS